MTTQSEIIVWHKPEVEIPKVNGFYLITCTDVETGKTFTNFSTFELGVFSTGFNIIAWSPMPRGWDETPQLKGKYIWITQN